MREFFAKRGVEPADVPAPEADKPMVDTATGPEIADEEDDEKSAMQRLSEMNVPQKMSRATKGTREERAILIRDPNKLIAVSVPEQSEADRTRRWKRSRRCPACPTRSCASSRPTGTG